jgi:hypothetical protein
MRKNMGLSNAGQKPFIVDLTTWASNSTFENGTPYNGLFTLSGNVKTAYTATYSADHSKSWESNKILFNFSPALSMGGELADMKRAMQAWSDVSGIKFAENNANPQLVVSQVDWVIFGDENSVEWIYGVVAPKTIVDGKKLTQADIGIYAPLTDFSNGSAGYKTMIHEVGHAMGLSHPNMIGDNQNYDRSQTIMSRPFNNEMRHYGDVRDMLPDMAF